MENLLLEECWQYFAEILRIVTLYLKPGSEKCFLTYLPPIPKPITEYSTIMEVFFQSRNYRNRET